MRSGESHRRQRDGYCSIRFFSPKAHTHQKEQMQVRNVAGKSSTHRADEPKGGFKVQHKIIAEGEK